VPDLSRPLRECLTAMEEKRNLQDVLRRYPRDREELVELLRLAVDLQGLGPPAPDPAFRLRARNRMLAAAADRRHTRHRPLKALPRRTVRVAFAGAFAVALAVGGLTAAAASDSSLPGEPLYAVKLAAEQAQMAITFNPADRARLQLRFADVRLQEAQRLFALGRKQDAMRLVAQYDAAVALFNESVATSALDSATIGALSRFVDERQAHADASLDALAGSLSAAGDPQAAAVVARTQSQVDQAFDGSKRDLQAHASDSRQGVHPSKSDGAQH
jgi:hypothetical protein